MKDVKSAAEMRESSSIGKEVSNLYISYVPRRVLLSSGSAIWHKHGAHCYSSEGIYALANLSIAPISLHAYNLLWQVLRDVARLGLVKVGLLWQGLARID
jgi:hypothetical protein